MIPRKIIKNRIEFTLVKVYEYFARYECKYGYCECFALSDFNKISVERLKPGNIAKY